MTALLDDLGTWRQLGTIRPEFQTWQVFPIPASSGFTTFRLSFSGVWKYPSLTWVYLRGVYQLIGQEVVDGRWIKAYPSENKPIISLPINPEFGLQQLNRFIQITKGVSRKWNNYAILNEQEFFNYTVTCEEFIPYPETVQRLREITLSQQSLDAISQQLTNLLPSSINPEQL